MTLFRLCQLAEQFGIEIDYFTMRDTKSLALPQGWIALDTCLLYTSPSPRD